MAFDQQNPQDPRLFKHELRSGLSWRLFVFLIIIFTALSLSYFGLEYGYKAFLRNSIAGYDKKINDIGNKFDAETQKNLIAFYSQIQNLKSLFAKHVFPSDLLNFLEASTSPNVAYTDASVDMKTNILTLDGLAKSYGTLVSQASYWESQKSVVSVTLGQSSLDKGLVRFTVKISFIPNFFLMDPNQTATPAPVPPPSPVPPAATNTTR